MSQFDELAGPLVEALTLLKEVTRGLASVGSKRLELLASEKVVMAVLAFSLDAISMTELLQQVRTHTLRACHEVELVAWRWLL